MDLVGGSIDWVWQDLNRWNISLEQNGCMQAVIQILLPLKQEDRKGTLLTETRVDLYSFLFPRDLLNHVYVMPVKK